MNNIFSKNVYLAAFIGLFALVSAPAFAQSGFTAAEIAAAPNCARFPNDQDGYLCSCAAGFDAGSVWGSGPYTADSNICSAAQHSGILSALGGTVFATSQGEQTAFKGSERNGVTSRDWGAYGSSFMVQAAQASSFLEACTRLPNGADSLTCACGAEQNGSVWGSGPYTADSNICAAARHAGILADGASAVTVLRIGGLDAYSGSESNGITSRNWGSYSSSIIFNGN